MRFGSVRFKCTLFFILRNWLSLLLLSCTLYISSSPAHHYHLSTPCMCMCNSLCSFSFLASPASPGSECFIGGFTLHHHLPSRSLLQGWRIQTRSTLGWPQLCPCMAGRQGCFQAGKVNHFARLKLGGLGCVSLDGHPTLSLMCFKAGKVNHFNCLEVEELVCLLGMLLCS